MSSVNRSLLAPCSVLYGGESTMNQQIFLSTCASAAEAGSSARGYAGAAAEACSTKAMSAGAPVCGHAQRICGKLGSGRRDSEEQGAQGSAPAEGLREGSPRLSTCRGADREGAHCSVPVTHVPAPPMVPAAAVSILWGP